MLQIKAGVTVPVERDGVEVGSFRFNPNDVRFTEQVYELIGQMDEAEQSFNRRAAELDKDTAKDKHGIPVNLRARLALMREVCEMMTERIDMVFGASTSALCFDGALDLDAIWQFFDGVSPYLDEAQKERIAKYTAKNGNRQQRRALSK